MKKSNFAKILTLVLVCAALIGAVVGINASAANEQTIEIVSNNVYYGETLQLLYAVDAPVLNDGDKVVVNVYYYEGGVKKLWCAADESGTVTLNEVDYKKFYSNRGVPVQDINTNLYAEASIVDANGDVVCTDVQRYSVLEYLYERLNISANVTANQRAMYTAHLAYAEAAEKVLYEDQKVERASYTNPVAGYFYVNVEGATFDGGNVAGMYANGATPFADIAPTIEIGENQKAMYTIGSAEYDADTIKAVAITALTKVVAKAADEDVEVESNNYVLLTDASQLKAGAKIIIVNTGLTHAMGADKGNNRNVATFTTNGDKIIPGTDVQIITLEAGLVDGTFAFNVGDASYLYAASSGSNYLKTTTTLDENGSWLVTVDANGVATVKAQGSYTRNWMRYNSSSSIFACYASGQVDIKIYINEDDLCAHENYTDATCQKPATCTNCGATKGDVVACVYENGTCKWCGQADPSLCAHEVWLDATCEAPKTCASCGETEGDALGHDMSEATCQAPSTCQRPNCGHTEGGTVAHVYVDGQCKWCQESENAQIGPITYEFSSYTAGTQYAKDEVHKLDEYVTVTTTDCHFTTQLRLYSSTTNNGYAIIESTKAMTAISLNAGNKVDTLNVYVSDDGVNWELASGVSVSSTSYKDYAVDLGGSYKFIKLDVAGSNQIRVAKMTITFG